jgi:hypothetical protein
MKPEDFDNITARCWRNVRLWAGVGIVLTILIAAAWRSLGAQRAAQRAALTFSTTSQLLKQDKLVVPP